VQVGSAPRACNAPGFLGVDRRSRVRCGAHVPSGSANVLVWVFGVMLGGFIHGQSIVFHRTLFPGGICTGTGPGTPESSPRMSVHGHIRGRIYKTPYSKRRLTTSSPGRPQATAIAKGSGPVESMA